MARFIEITAGIAPPEGLVEAVYRETEGNPFFVNEIVRLLVADGRLERPEEVKSWSVTIPRGCARWWAAASTTYRRSATES